MVSSLGDPGGPILEMLANRSAARPKALVSLDDIKATRGSWDASTAP